MKRPSTLPFAAADEMTRKTESYKSTVHDERCGRRLGNGGNGSDFDLFMPRQSRLTQLGSILQIAAEPPVPALSRP